MSLVIDTSALVAIAAEEPECDSFIERLEAADEILISSVNYVETGGVLTTHRLFTSREAIDTWLADYRVQVAREPAIEAAALDAYLRFGKGRHPARLNLADCFAYALAKSLNAPLLYKGDNFPLTDVRSALDV
jgi:ribonuclease VapC